MAPFMIGRVITIAILTSTAVVRAYHINIEDANREWKPSDRLDYEYMVSLPLYQHQPTSSSSSLVFYWNDSINGRFSAELFHRTRLNDAVSDFDPESSYIPWLGFGISDADAVTRTGKNLDAEEVNEAMVVGSMALIGRTTRSIEHSDLEKLSNGSGSGPTAAAEKEIKDTKLEDVMVVVEDDEIDLRPIHEFLLKDETQKQLEDESDEVSFPNLTHLEQNYLKQFREGDEIITILKFNQSMEAWNISPTDGNYFLYGVGSNSYNDSQSHIREFFSSFVLNFESMHTSTTTTTDKGATSQDSKKKWSSSKKIFFIHGLVGAAAFAVFMPLAFTSVFLKELIPEKWMTYHLYSNIAVGMLGLMALVFALAGKAFQEDGTHFGDSHHITGLILLVLMPIQIKSGMMKPGYNTIETRIPSELINDPYRLALRERSWLRIHMVAVLIVFVLGLYQTGSGFCTFAKLYDSKNFAPGFCVFIALFTSCIIITKASFILFPDRNQKDTDESGSDTDNESHHELL